MYYVINSALKFDVGKATDAQEANALGYRDYQIDVYSNSWGPSDSGFIVDGPDSLVQNTLITGVTEVCISFSNMTDQLLCSKPLCSMGDDMPNSIRIIYATHTGSRRQGKYLCVGSW